MNETQLDRLVLLLKDFGIPFDKDSNEESGYIEVIIDEWDQDIIPGGCIANFEFNTDGTFRILSLHE